MVITLRDVPEECISLAFFVHHVSCDVCARHVRHWWPGQPPQSRPSDRGDVGCLLEVVLRLEI